MLTMCILEKLNCFSYYIFLNFSCYKHFFILLFGFILLRLINVVFDNFS